MKRLSTITGLILTGALAGAAWTGHADDGWTFSPFVSQGVPGLRPLEIPAPTPQSWIDQPMADWLSRMTGEPVTEGNELTLYVDGTEFFEPRLEMIRNAKATIDIGTFLWCDDASGLAVANELAKASQRGVRVRTMIDALNTKPHQQVYSILAAAQAYPLIWSPTQWGMDAIFNHSPHEKVMVVDGERAIIGGANLCDEYLNPKAARGLWHDFEFHLRGPIAARVQARYDANWNWVSEQDFQAHAGLDSFMESPAFQPTYGHSYQQFPEPTESTTEHFGYAKALYLYQQSYHYKDHPAKFRKIFSELVKRARKRVVMYTPYYSPPEEVEGALVEMAGKGVEVVVMTNSEESTDMAGIVIPSSYRHYQKILPQGVRVREFTDVTLHGKAVLIDDTVLAVGSHNQTPHAFNHNGEAMVLTGDQAAIAKFTRTWEADLKRTRAVTPQSAMKKILEKGKLWIEKGKFFENFF